MSQDEAKTPEAGSGGGFLKRLLGGSPSGKFGTFAGVFTPSVLTILGVIMFLRSPWVVGHAGLGGALLIVVIAHLLTIPTALSVSSIATNRKVKGGGDYYMLSRSLGLEVGGAIGVALFFAQALSVTLYVLGFTEALVDVFPGLPSPVISVVTVLLVAGLAFWNTSLALKSQFFIMALIALSLVSIFTGSGGKPPAEIAFWAKTVDGQPPERFVAVFAVFFPAVTGFTQGVSMSGDLEDPRKSIPRGTFAAVAVGILVYVGLIVLAAVKVDTANLRRLDVIIFKQIASVGILVTIGIWGATLSSAMGSILGAPRILQALAADGVVPRFLGKGHGPTNMPRVATLAALVVALSGLGLAYTSPSGLNAIAQVITMFFLASYGFISLACGLAKWSRTPSFRPTFKVPAFISLAGAFGCFYMMSLINLPAMIASVVIVSLIYLGLQRKHLTKAWGDLRHGIWAALIRKGLSALREAEYHPINWQPNIVVLGGSPLARSHLLKMGHWLGGRRGIVTYFFLLTGDPESEGAKARKLEEGLADRVAKDHPNVFTRVQVCEELFGGAFSVVQAHGLTGFEPNTVVMGWSHDVDHADGYARLIRRVDGLDKCLMLVSHRSDREFGRFQSIDIWWGGLERNGALMLLMAALLTEEPPWENASVRVKMIVPESAPMGVVRRNLESIIAQARVDAEAEIIVRKPENRPIPDIIAEKSDADLILMGLRLPGADETGRAFVDRVNALVDRLPTTVLVKSSSDFEGAEMLFEQEFTPRKKRRPRITAVVDTAAAKDDEELSAPVAPPHPLEGVFKPSPRADLEKQPKSQDETASDGDEGRKR